MMANMRVLSICDISPNRFGSFEEFLIELTGKLNNTGFEHIIIFREKPIKDVEEALLNIGAKLKIIKPSRHKIYNFVTFYKIIKEVRPDIVHFHFYPIYTVVNYLKFIFNIKIVYTDHMGGRQTKSSLKKTLRIIYYRINSKLFDCGIDKITCVSNFIKLKYSKEYGIHSKKLYVIYNGININRFQKNRDMAIIKEKYGIRDEYVVSCVGLRRDKGPQCLIKAVPTIIKQIPNIKFILVGEGECKVYLQTLIDKLNIKKYVLFVGNVSDIKDIYNISSCTVIPSLFEEAFCFVAAEAMATETPIIAFDSGAIKDVVFSRDQIIPKNYKILSDKIVNCLKNHDNINFESRLHVVDNFSLGKCTDSYVQLYVSLLENK